MRVREKLTGAFLGLLLSSGSALPQETVLSGVLTQFLPEARVSWSSGVASAGTETYEDLFVGDGDLRLRASRVMVTPEGPVARISAEGVVVNLDTDETLSLEIGTVTTSLSAPLLSALGGVEGLIDLCRLGATGTSLELTDLRGLGDVKQEGLRRVRSEVRADRVSLRQEVSPVGGGCRFEVSLDLLNGQEVRSDKSGTRIDRFGLTLSVPGNLQTLTAEGAPPLAVSATLAGLLRQVPGGASIALVRDGRLEGELTALSAVPALTALLRNRGRATPDRVAATLRALTPADVSATASLTGTTLLVEALVPADRISGLSRASLTSVIGDYRARLRTRAGLATVEVGSDLVGVGESSAALRARVSERGPDAPDRGLPPTLEAALPRVDLEEAVIRHQDRGLLRAVELITGSPVSVLAAIYLNEGVVELPEPWRPAARRAASELARFLSLTPQEDGAELLVRTPTDLSVLETYRLLTLRPELVDRLVASEVRQAPSD